MVNVGESSRHDDQKYRTTEHSQVYEWNTARRSISSTFASGTDISPAMASTSAQHEKLIQSTPDLRNKRIAAMFSIESSDSGAITLSDGDCKPFRLGESVQKQTLNSENTISEESVREQCCTTQYDSFFMPKGTKVKCYHVLRDITMLEYSTLIELSILIEDFYAIFPEKAISSARVLTDLFEELRDLECFHSGYLSTLQILLQKWDKSLQNTPAERPRIGDILLCSVHNALQHYRKFVQNSPIYLAAINEFTRANSAFAESLNRLQMKHSYCFNINFVMLKVIHRMVVWQNLLGRMVAAFLEDCNENETASQLSSCRVALEKKKATLEGLVHFIKFVELGDDLNIIDGLTDPLRRFIRQGWLCKWTKRGFISHVVILFNDALLFAHRSQTSGFIRNAFLPLRSMKVEEGDALHVVTDPTLCLTIRAVGRTFLMSSDCTRVRDIWFEEIRRAIDNAKNSAVEKLPQTETFVITEASFDDEFMRNDDGTLDGSESPDAAISNRAKGVPCSTLDVCWYRHATLGINAIIAAPTNQMSGYLLRKYRNSTEWEKLWVVHANFALIFFQSHQEKEPLALLPIVSYHISLPQLNDEIDCDNVFKVSYNTHCYFFRTDSLYSFSKNFKFFKRTPYFEYRETVKRKKYMQAIVLREPFWWYECIRESAISSSPLDVIASFSPT